FTMPLFVAVTPVIVVEELGPFAAVRRSAQLMRRRYWGAMGIALLSALVAYVIGQVVGLVPSLAGLLIGLHRGGWVLVAVGGSLSWLVQAPLLANFVTLLYFDARIRHEGFDLQVIAADLAASGAPA